MTTSTENFIVQSPGQLIANIPGALGFYPTESLVLMGFNKTLGRYTLGPTVRMDIDKIPETMNEVTDTLHQMGCEMLMGFLITTRPEELIDAVVTDLYYHRCLRSDLEIVACWHVPQVRTGEEYAIWFGPEAYSTTDNPHWRDWETGRVSSITDSATMTDFVREGRLPDINREESLAPLRDINPHFTVNELMALERTAMDAASDLHSGRGIQSGRGGDERAYALADVPVDVDLLLKECAAKSFADISADWEILTTVAMWMSTTCTRDIVMGACIVHAEAAEKVLLAVAQSMHHTARHNALCIYGAVLIARKFSMRTGAVLATVLEEDPDHSLAGLMMQAYRSGLHEWLVDSLVEGSNIACEKLTCRASNPVPLEL